MSVAKQLPKWVESGGFTEHDLQTIEWAKVMDDLYKDYKPADSLKARYGSLLVRLVDWIDKEEKQNASNSSDQE